MEALPAGRSSRTRYPSKAGFALPSGSMEDITAFTDSNAVTLVAPSEVSEATTVMAADAPIPDVLFTSASATIRLLASLDGDAVVIGHVSPTDFLALERERDAHRPHARLFYFDDTECVIITVPTAAHEALHLQLYEIIIVEAHLMGNGFVLQQVGSTTYRGPNGVSSGEGDSGGFPINVQGQGGWPSIVFESGYSQSMSSLHAKMRWWFSASAHRVKVVILAKMFVTETQILVEKWQECPAVGSRPGATTTRRSAVAALQPVCLQKLDIAWAGPGLFSQATQAELYNRTLYRVTGGPLTIDFSAVFLRNPTAQEHGFVITDDQLQMTAGMAWSRSRN